MLIGMLFKLVLLSVILIINSVTLHSIIFSGLCIMVQFHVFIFRISGINT